MLIIFDCDGVVLDSMALHNEIESEAYAKLGIHIPPRELAKRFSGMKLADEFKILERETGVVFPPDAEARIDARKEKVFTERLKAVPHIVETLDALKGIPRCLASGSTLHQLHHGLTITGLYNRFAPHIFSAEQVAHGKPAPDLFLFAAGQMGVAPEDGLVIEDAVAGIQGARAAGMRAFGFVGGTHCDAGHSDGKQGERLMAAGAELVFADLRELPGLIDKKNGVAKRCAG
jgi:HAD superfamily hydrolase (TIGR01509 family)